MTMIFLVVSVCFVSAETTAEKSTDVEMVIDLSAQSTTLTDLESTDLNTVNFIYIASATKVATEVNFIDSPINFEVCDISQNYKQIVNRNYFEAETQEQTVETTYRTGIGLS